MSEVMPHLTGMRYVVPLREGGSLPAVVETDGGAYVVKFRGAGQGPKALVAEAIAASLAVALGLPVPRPALVELADGFGRSEPDPEIQDILRGSVGLNFGLAYLPGALAWDPAVDAIDPALAAEIVWFDALITNVDRTVRNTNLLLWKEGVWMIDHGASLFFHHRWQGWRERIQSPFPQIKDHVLLHRAENLPATGERLRRRLDRPAVRAVIEAIPGDWLEQEPEVGDTDAVREAYVTYLTERLDGPQRWLQEAIDAQGREPEKLAPRLTHRVV